LDIVATLAVSQVINNRTAEVDACVPLPASPSILSPPTKTSKNKDDNDADSIGSGNSTKYEEDDFVPKMASLQPLERKNGKDSTKSTTKNTSNITFDDDEDEDDDDDYIEDNQFSQQHYWLL
jgi:hypothetical protein